MAKSTLGPLDAKSLIISQYLDASYARNCDQKKSACGECAQAQSTSDYKLPATEELTPNNVIDIMLRDERSWNIVVKYVEEVMQAREAEERRSQTQH